MASCNGIGSSAILLLFATTWSIASCGRPLPEPTAAVVQEPVAATATGGMEETPTGSPTTATPTEPAHRASGLVFGNSDGTWWITPSGDVELLMSGALGTLSPDLDALLYVVEGEPLTFFFDIWLMDLGSGERRNLTNSSERDEVGKMWVPGHPDVILFGSDTETDRRLNSKYPTIVHRDGSGYEILDAEHGGLRTVSPDGSTIYYGGFGGTLQTITLDGQKGMFDLNAFGLTFEKLFLLEWSPDGRAVACFLGGDFEGVGTPQVALALFELESETATILHAYTPFGGSEFGDQIEWSPDGAWLAFTTHGEPPATGREPNLWVIRPDGSEEAHIGEGWYPVWRYDSQLLGYTSSNARQLQEFFLTTPELWESTALEDVQRPEGFMYLEGWVDPEHMMARLHQAPP